MSPRAFLVAVFLGSFLIAASGMVTHVLVRIALRRRGIRVQFFLSGMPTYFLRLCRELPASPENARLVGLEKWSVLSLLISFIGVGISGPMLVSLDHEAPDLRWSGHAAASRLAVGGNR